MNQTESKKQWRKPELVVIIRCRSEEDVLAACKAGYRACGTESGAPAHAIASS